MRSGWLLWVVALAVVLSGPAAPSSTASAGTLERVRERGVLRCGVTTSGVGLAMMDEGGHWKGFFVDLCRAVAAAATGGATMPSSPGGAGTAAGADTSGGATTPAPRF